MRSLIAFSGMGYKVHCHLTADACTLLNNQQPVSSEGIGIDNGDHVWLCTDKAWNLW